MSNMKRATEIVEEHDSIQANSPDDDLMVLAIRKALDEAEQRGYERAKAEMLSKLDTFNPTYVEGGRVPEDAIEHRNQPRAKE